MSQTEQQSQTELQPAEVINKQLDLGLLTRGRLVIIGLGGIGLFLARALTAFLMGLRTALADDEDIDMLLVDGKVYNERHLYRMAVPDFINKAMAVADEILQQHDCLGFNVRYLPEFVTEANVGEVIQEGDVVMMGVDNHATRHLVNEYCFRGALDNVVLISGGNDGVENGQTGSYGNVQLYIRENGVDRTAPLHRFHPEIADPQDQSPAELGCDESGVAQLTITNQFAAAMMCSTLLRLLMAGEKIQPYDEVAFDVVEGISQPHWLSTKPR